MCRSALELSCGNSRNDLLINKVAVISLEPIT